MCEIATYVSSEVHSNYDPTHTTMLRNAFANEMKKRFNELARMVAISVNKNDCFGLKENKLFTFQMTPAVRHAFAFTRSAEKINSFMQWLRKQEEAGLIKTGYAQQLGSSAENAWMNMYILDSYKRGVIRARNEMRKAGANIPSIEDSGGIEIIMNGLLHMDRVGLLYTRVFTDLQGITTAMDSIISRILAQGLVDGDGAALLARKLVASINGSGLGDLALTDSLGRFIPALRRATILARTELIRSHHLGTIQEYRNWGVLGITVKGEWKTAGDDRVCPKCEALEGKIFTLDEIEGLIPLHPQCFIDYQIPIYTSQGWKQIGDIKIGDLVLTHNLRFRKVYALPRHKEKAEVVTFKFDGWKQDLTITKNHPVLVTTKDGSLSRWMKAGNIKEGMYVNYLGGICKKCGKTIPYYREYCSQSCLSKTITEKQWANPEHRKIVSEKNRISINKQYTSGERDRFAVTKKANEKTREMVIEGEHPFQRLDVIEKNKLITNLPKHRKASSERMKLNNPMSDPTIVEKVQEAIKRHLIENPEKRINTRMAKYRKSGNKTWIEERMGLLLDKLGIEYVFQYPILRYNVDFAIPELMIAIECDGEQWHQDKEKEQIRQEKIEHEGWLVLHYTGAKINQCLPEIEKELARVLCNHLGEYNLISYPVISVRKWTLKRKTTLYNLSVEEDESYIAKGLVVHNCRCIALPYIEELQKYNTN